MQLVTCVVIVWSLCGGVGVWGVVVVVVFSMVFSTVFNMVFNKVFRRA